MSDLYAELQQRMPKLQDFAVPSPWPSTMNTADGTTVLQDNDEVALIPPVSGGKDEEPSTAETPLAADLRAHRLGLP